MTDMMFPTPRRAALVERMALDIGIHVHAEMEELRIAASAALDLALEEAAKAAFEACACNGAAAAIRTLKGNA
jgi:hypothetical protein